ncbi:MAG TPA: 2-oxoacid:acceptor oxidoreductase family protein [Bacillota bacterium]|nr:2-oxoacid:acceptor oxidoreductase family protein [Bacillota bacterium]
MHYCIKLAGIQGEGVDTVGELLSAYLHAKGFHVYAYRNFTSRIRGGYSSHEIAFGSEQIRSKQAIVNLLIALDREGLRRDLGLVSEAGLVIADEEAIGEQHPGLLAFPIVSKAKEGPGSIFKWTMALGVMGALLDIPQEEWHPILAAAFERKGEKVINTNIEALNLGYGLASDTAIAASPLPDIGPARGQTRAGSRLIQGSEAIVESALAVGCDFTAGYPISPASEVFSLLAREFEPGGTRRAVQTEDEISAVFMAIGASYAGATPLVATSGPGLSLMVEGIGLASMTRTPLAIVDAQRTGPSTGMPTKHEQSDLSLALAGGHGDVRPLVVAPSCLEDIFTDLPRAFSLAEEYRSPVIFLTDFALMSARTDVESVQARTVDLSTVRRRPLPGAPDTMFHSTGNQQGADGLPTDLPKARKAYMLERMQQLNKAPAGENFTHVSSGKDVLIVCLGSTRGAVESAWPEIESVASALYLRLLSPLPTAELGIIFSAYEHILVLDCNASGQLLDLLRSGFSQHRRFTSARRFDGEPFIADDVVKAVREAIDHV